MAEQRVLNPDDLIHRLSELSNLLAGGVQEVTKRERDWVEAKAAYDAAYAIAFNRAEPPEYAKRFAAEEATIEHRQRMDATRVMFNYAQRQARRLETELTTAQSQLKAITSMYGGAGVGHGA